MEETKIALLVIYNHRFDKNIARVESLYKNRFSNIFHIMPFYDGDVENVIPVYESSYYFQGYVAQAYTHLKRKGFSHFFIIADDLILNPSVSESNIFEKMGIDSDSCWIGGDKIEFQNLEIEWSRLSEALTFSLKVSGVEVSNILPSKEVAVDKFKKFLDNNILQEVMRIEFLHSYNNDEAFIDYKNSVDNKKGFFYYCI